MGKRVSEADALARAAAKDLTPLEPYPGRTHLPWRLRHSCGEEVITTLGNLTDTRHAGACRTCAAQVRGSARAHTTEDATARLNELGSDFIPDEPYPGSVKEPWRGHCVHGHPLSHRFEYLLKMAKQSHPVCAACKGARITADEALSRAREKGFIPGEPYPGKGNLPWQGTCAQCRGNITTTGYYLNRSQSGICRRCGNHTRATKRRMSEAQAIERAASHGYVPTEPYPGSSTAKWRLRHECGTETQQWSSSDLARKRGVVFCATCRSRDIRPDVVVVGELGLRAEKTLADCYERAVREGYAIERAFMLPGSETTASRLAFDLRCPRGHTYTVAASMFKQGQRCRKCHERGRADKNAEAIRELALTRNELIERVWLKKRATGNSSSLWVRVQCALPEHPAYEMLAWNYKDGHGCPICNVGGGYDTNVPGVLYAVAGNELLKVGISNTHAACKRLVDHRRQGLKEQLWAYTHDDGQVAFDLERTWMLYRSQHDDLPTVDHLKDGWTEAMFDNSQTREWIIKELGPRMVSAGGSPFGAEARKR